MLLLEPDLRDAGVGADDVDDGPPALPLLERASLTSGLRGVPGAALAATTLAPLQLLPLPLPLPALWCRWLLPLPVA